MGVIVSHRLAGLVATLAFSLTGCSTSVEVRGEFPKPLVQQLPIKVGLYYDDAFRNFTHRENSEDRKDWVIATGPSQIALFGSVAAGLFQTVREIDTAPEAGVPDLDLIVAPEVDELQYSMPRETRVNVFEVWIKYKIRLYKATGETLADWIITAYGKTPTAFLRSKNQALNLAVNAALRDAGASFTRGFDRVPEVREWLEQENKLTQARRF